MTRIDTEGLLTKTAVYTPIGAAGVDISAAAYATQDWTIFIRVTNLSAASGTPGARFVIQDSVNDFVAFESGPCADFRGAVNAAATITKEFRKRDFPLMRFGTASAEVRVALTQIQGTTPTCTYEAWIEFAS